MVRNDRVDTARGERIRHVRIEVLKLRSQEKFAELLGTGVTRGAVGNWELGKDIGLKNLRAIAEVAEVSLEWLTEGHGEPPQGEARGNWRGGIALRGFVGAGQAIYAMDEPGETVEAPAGAKPDTVAVEVRGDSMYPAYQDGEILYYSRNLPPHDMVNRRGVVKLADGRMLVKIVRPGSTPTTWRLQSINTLYPDMVDEVVDWVAPIDWVKPI